MKKIGNSWHFLQDEGLLFEINVKVLHKYGLSLEIDSITNGIKLEDHRKVSGGLLLSPLEWTEGALALANFVSREGGATMKDRIDLIGCLVQDRPDPLDQEGPHGRKT